MLSFIALLTSDLSRERSDTLRYVQVLVEYFVLRRVDGAERGITCVNLELE